MNRFNTLIFAALFGLLALPTWAGGKADKKASITFHIEADENDNPKMIAKALVGTREKIFRRIPEITQREVSACTPFRADDGTFGVVLHLKPNGARRLAALTNTNINRYLLAKVNGRTVDYAVIDRPITDGQLVIWQGITEEEIQEFSKLLPRPGQQKK